MNSGNSKDKVKRVPINRRESAPDSNNIDRDLDSCNRGESGESSACESDMRNCDCQGESPSPDHEETITYPDREGGETSSLDDQIQSLTQENAQLLDALKRERASFINYRQRVEEEKSQIRRYSAQDIAFDLLNVLDYFEASLNFDDDKSDLSSVIQGVQYTIDEMRRILAKYGVEEIKTDIAFDPRFHEAFSTVVSDEAKPGTIISVHRKGYIYKDRVLRPAMVTVAVSQDESEKTTI